MGPIAEDYISFKVAKLLKEKGFDEKCYLQYKENGTYIVRTESPVYNSLLDDNDCAGPTQSMAMKWLRKQHNFNVNIELTINGYFCSFSHIVRDSLGYIIDIEYLEAWKTPYYDSYEKACDEGIKYCLENLI